MFWRRQHRTVAAQASHPSYGDRTISLRNICPLKRTIVPRSPCDYRTIIVRCPCESPMMDIIVRWPRERRAFVVRLILNCNILANNLRLILNHTVIVRVSYSCCMCVEELSSRRMSKIIVQARCDMGLLQEAVTNPYKVLNFQKSKKSTIGRKTRDATPVAHVTAINGN